MAHTAPKSKSSSSWKIWVLIAVLMVVIIALAVVFALTLFRGGQDAQTADDGSGASVAPGIFTKVDAKYGDGRNAAGSISVTEGTKLPDSIPAQTEDVVLLDIAWTGESELTEPVFLTVSDPSFTDGDGLTVHEYNEQTDQWDTLGPYRIQDNSVTFQVADLSSFAFQVVSANPVATEAPQVVATPEPTAEPTPVPTPEPIAVVDYGNYGGAQSGVYTLADQFEDGDTYVVALVQNMTGDAAAAQSDAGEQADDAGDSAGTGLSISYVEAPDANPDTEGEVPAEPVSNQPKATVLMNMDGQTMHAVDMPLLQAEDGTWYLGGPITEGMLWKATRDIYTGNDYRYSLQNNGRYLNTDDDHTHIILTDNSVRTRWLVATAELSDGTELTTLNYRDPDRYYVSGFGMEYQALADSMFEAGTGEAAPAGVAYLGTDAPADQTLVQEVLRFAVTTDQTQALQLAIFKLDADRSVPADVQTNVAHRITVPAIDANSDLSALDIRDGETPLQLGVDYTIAAKVYNNSTVVVVVTFIGNYSGQVVRTYPGTSFRTDSTQPTPSPEPTATPAPTAPAYTGGGGSSSNNNSSSNTPPTNDPATNTNTSTGGSSGGSSSGGTFEDPDPESATDSEG